MITFLRQFFRDSRNTGSLMPSSPALARAMVSGLGGATHERWLEVGPGTGPFTRAMLAAKRSHDAITIVELSSDFCKQLERDVLAPWRSSNAGHTGAVTLIHASIEDAALEPGFDHIVCGLPFNNFPPEQVEAILVQLRGLVRPGGTMRYFAYLGARTLRDSRDALLRRDAPISKIEARVFAGCTRTSELVIANVPPAKATLIQIPS